MILQIFELRVVVQMLSRRLQTFHFSTNRYNAFVLRNAQHTEARFIFGRSAAVHATKLHQRIPRLTGVFFCGIRVDIGHLTPSTTRHDVEVDFVQRRLAGPHGRDADPLPAVLFPGGIVAAAHNDVGAEALNGQRVLVVGFVAQARVEVPQRRFRRYLETHDVGEVVRDVGAVQLRTTVDPDQALRWAFVHQGNVALEVFAEDPVNLRPVLPRVGVLLPDFDCRERRVGFQPLLAGEGRSGDHLVSPVNADLEHVNFVLLDDARVDQSQGRLAADRHELARRGVDEHPVPIECEPRGPEPRRFNLESATRLDWVNAQSDDLRGLRDGRCIFLLLHVFPCRNGYVRSVFEKVGTIPKVPVESRYDEHDQSQYEGLGRRMHCGVGDPGVVP